MAKQEFSIIIPIKNRTYFKVNYEPPGLSIFRNHVIESSNLPKYKIDKRGTDLVLQLLINNLESLSNLVDKYDFEVILVDFGSTDYNKKKLKSQFPKLKINIIDDESFFSRGKGLNIGFQASTKKNIMFCDADMMFHTDDVFKSAISELDKGKVFFPICFDLIEPSHQVGYWRESGFGIMFGNKKHLQKLGFKWSEYDSLGKEDDDAHEFFNSKNLVTRYKVKGYYHQWHPSSKFFKNSNYKTASINPNAVKILINFDEKLVEDKNHIYYLDCLRKDPKYFCVNNLECDTEFVLNYRKLAPIAQKKQVEEYEKKYVRKIIYASMDRLHILPRDFRYFENRYPQNPKWLNEVLDWILRIERNDYSWTLHGTKTWPLSSASLFAKLVRIFENYFQFDKTKLRNLIVGYIDETDAMFKQNRDNERIISESRQAYSALINLGYNVVENNKYDVKIEEYFPKPLYFMSDKYWENPWKAGAHLSHYIFFNYMRGDKQEIENVFNGIKKYAKKDGWYHGNPTEEQIINGVMKVFTAFDVVGKEVDKNMAKGIIDRLLKAEKYEGGCGVYDYVYVLIRCLPAKHREDEIKKRLYDVYDMILDYQMPDGGFKYSKDPKKKDTYSSKEVAVPGPYGCIHPTTVFCMALTMINSALDLGLNMNLAFS